MMIRIWLIPRMIADSTAPGIPFNVPAAAVISDELCFWLSVPPLSSVAVFSILSAAFCRSSSALLLFIHRWGVGKGLLIGFAYGLLDMLIDGGYAWGWQSMVLDYMVAYTALGLGGFFRGKAWGMLPCVAVGCLGRYAGHYFSGITLYRILEPTAVEGLESMGAIANAHVYSLLYNGVYMLPNMVIALVLAALLFAPLKKYYAGNDLRK